ncbi:hypothetical protein [Peribacillus frigoritolerans]|jgi:hypothetical protein|uniref:hypothetical protein n=1 Tax=Peribacillus frigoritolerans TaxID=450367 RepID=UPI000A47F9EE|nr:hypothetical protein [Peribacillus frigoritolerans]MCY9140059.1 hypothetical protein [Peribacillus frigoritolerans]
MDTQKRASKTNNVITLNVSLTLIHELSSCKGRSSEPSQFLWIPVFYVKPAMQQGNLLSSVW